jgi:hypothetical protein
LFTICFFCFFLELSATESMGEEVGGGEEEEVGGEEEEEGGE